LQAFYSIRSERQLVERIEFDLLFRWFVGLGVDGTLLKAWASTKSFRPKDGFGSPPDAGRNGAQHFHGQKRSNKTHASTTDPDARLYRKRRGKEAKLAFRGHALMENRNGLIVGAVATRASGQAERLAARQLIEPNADRPQNTNGRHSAIEGRATRHVGYAISLRIRKRIEEAFS